MMLLTAVFAQNLAVGDELRDEVERRRRRRCLVHVAEQFGASELPLGVRLTFDLLECVLRSPGRCPTSWR